MNQEASLHSQELRIGPYSLAGTLVSPNDPKGIALLVHGLTGDRNQKGRFATLANALAKRGIASFRVDMRGRGETVGYLTPLTSIEDVKAAGEWLSAKYPGLNGTVVARGQGAYASVVAMKGNDTWSRIILWGAILHPRTSRELQGDYHSYRENGVAHLSLEDGTSITFNDEYFQALEDIPSAVCADRIGLDLTFVHSEKDDIAPLNHVQDFIKKLIHTNTRILTVEGEHKHMHHEKAYVDDYINLTLSAFAANTKGAL